MADQISTVRRTLHLRLRAPGVDPSQLLSLMKAAIPFYEAMGGHRIRVLRNVDDPSRFLQEIEYDTPAALELNRQRIASDPTMQAYLQTWRMLLAGAVEIDVYEDVTEIT
jgi:hypothetical protein